MVANFENEINKEVINNAQYNENLKINIFHNMVENYQERINK